MVDQQVFLFDDTVRENIRHARPPATDREVEAACRAAGCDGFIQKLEHGYDNPYWGKRKLSLRRGSVSVCLSPGLF